MPRGRRTTILAVIWLLATGIQAPAARAERERAVGPTPPRLAFIAGEVSFWRPGADDWALAQVNTALAAGDSLYVGEGGNVELQIGSRAYVRAGSGTQLGIDSLETGYLQLEVTSGHCAVDLKTLPEGQAIELDTPHGAFTIERPGYYRVDVDDNTTFTARRGGVATLVPAGGDTTDVDTDRQVVLAGAETATVTVSAAPDADDWDRWNFDRTGHLAERSRSAEYVPPAVAGVDDLDSYGEWRDTPRYGHVWAPRDVPADWAPYSTGRWVYDPSYEWTWVDEAPWGWAPYHYGRWCWADGYWGWAPGPVIAAPVYAPALVAFFGGGGVSVGVSVGTPFVSWVALGWGEPVVPWWGPSAFIGRPYWGGWGGPRIVNNVVINQTTIVNVNTINRFSNVAVRNAVVGVHRDQFGRGRGDRVRFAAEDVRRLQPVRGQIGVRPVAASLVPRAERAQRPPEQIRNRRVVATRPPQDTSRRLRAAGIETHGPARPVEPRVVQPSRGRERGAGERSGPDRMTPPPPPGRERGALGERGARERGRANERGMERGLGNEPGAPNERGTRHERGGANDRGLPNGGSSVERRGHAVPPPPGTERAPAEGRGRPNVEVERGRHAAPSHEVPPPPAGERGRVRGGADIERGRHVAPPSPSEERRPGSDRGGVNVERGRHAAPAPFEARQPASERGGADVGRGRHAAPPPPSVHERAPFTERGGANVERHPSAPPPVPRDVPAPRSERGREGRMDRGAPAPQPFHERAVERTAPREQVRPEPPGRVVPDAGGRERPQDAGDAKHGGHGREPRDPKNP